MRNCYYFLALVLLLSACAGEITPTSDSMLTPILSDTPTITNTPRPQPPRPTATGPRALPPRMQTLPATFTPTFTPTYTLTPTLTFTPTITRTPTRIPEAALCQSVDLQTSAVSGRLYTSNSQGMSFAMLVPTERVLLRLTITQEGADEPLIDGTVEGGSPQAIGIPMTQFMESGRYDWTVRLYDETRDDMCDGEFTDYFLVDLDVSTYTPTPITPTRTPTPAPEVTDETEPQVFITVVTATPIASTPSVRDVFNTATAAARGN